MTFEDLAPIGTEAGKLLKARGQSIAVVDGATGGLISAALLAMPGAPCSGSCLACCKNTLD